MRPSLISQKISNCCNSDNRCRFLREQRQRMQLDFSSIWVCSYVPTQYMIWSSAASQEHTAAATASHPPAGAAGAQLLGRCTHTRSVWCCAHTSVLVMQSSNDCSKHI
jgi:hypothetical protein